MTEGNGGIELCSPVPVKLWLDARTVDLNKQLSLTCPGAGEALDAARQTTLATPEPSLRTLCSTMQDCGDSMLAATWILAVPSH